ncbi:unnamed protein product, partial [Meganyctiphanes norvegica]
MGSHVEGIKRMVGVLCVIVLILDCCGVVGQRSNDRASSLGQNSGDRAASSYSSVNSTENERTCSTSDFHCKSSGRCIPKRWVCDYQKDCTEGEDEKENCPPPECDASQFACGEYVWNQTFCISSFKRCDKVTDCSDKSDEEGCSYRHCLEGDHHCGSDLCIPPTKKCDGYFDCRDESDEKGCNMTSCSPDKFRCPDKCIEQSQKCDHRDDCGDNSDEQDCNFPKCHEDQFRCDNALCIPQRWHCDGHNDCPDNSDEKNCTAIACPDTKFLCAKENKCIDKKKLCDSHRDCEDGSDERTACSAQVCPSLGCEYACRASLDGGECYCPPGKQVSNDTRTCIDKDECLEWGYCDQGCKNSDGFYNCTCKDGFTLALDNKRCKVTLREEQMTLFFTHHTKVMK